MTDCEIFLDIVKHSDIVSRLCVLHTYAYVVDSTVENGLEILEQGDRYIVVYKGRDGQSVIQPETDSGGLRY